MCLIDWLILSRLLSLVPVSISRSIKKTPNTHTLIVFETNGIDTSLADISWSKWDSGLIAQDTALIFSDIQQFYSFSKAKVMHPGLDIIAVIGAWGQCIAKCAQVCRACCFRRSTSSSTQWDRTALVPNNAKARKRERKAKRKEVRH